MRSARGALPLGGMDRARATIPGEGNPQPDEVFNLRPHRAGGLIPIGGTARYGTSIIGDIVGYDGSGLVTSDTGTGLWAGDGSTTHSSTAQHSERAHVTHVPGVGVQVTYAEFLYRAPDDSYFGRQHTGFSTSGSSTDFSATLVADSGSTLQHGEHHVMALICRAAKNGMLVVTRAWRSGNMAIFSGNPQRIDIKIPTLKSAEVCYLFAMYNAFGDSWDQWKLFKMVSQGDGTSHTMRTLIRGSVFPTASGFAFYALTHSDTAAIHNQRVWSVQPSGRSTSVALVIGSVGPTSDRIPQEPHPGDSGGPLSLHYTELGYINIADPGCTVSIPAQQSLKVTALVSSSSNEYGVFGGLLVFCNNEAFVVVGDPSLPDTFAIEPHPAAIGCDEGVRPVQIGGLLFVVWKGRVHVFSGANVQDISQAIVRPGEAFEEITGDVHTESIVARLSNGKWYRYFYKHDFWAVDPMTEHPSAASMVAWGGAHTDGPFFAAGDSIFRVVGDPDTLPTPHITWLDVDFGDPAMHKKLFSARTFMSGYSGGAGLRYNMHSGQGEVDASAPVVTATWDEGDGLFRFPPRVRGKRLDFRLDVEGATSDVVVESPVEVSFMPGYRKR